MKKIYLIFIIVLSTALSSCVKDLGELNKDPNNSTVSNPDLLFKYAIKRGMGSYITNSNIEYNGLHQWMMYFAKRNGVEPGNEYPSPSGGDAFWNESYIDAMNNVEVIIRVAGNKAEMANKKAAAMVWKSFIVHRITDLWGDVPYSEALSGNPNLEFTPTYDSQESIYTQLFQDLATAEAAFDEGMPFFTSESDLLFGGDLNKWKRFANALRFRLAIRISVVDPVLSQQQLAGIDPDMLINDESQTAAFQFNSVFNKPLYEAAVIRFQEGEQYINPSKFLTDLLTNSNDPRIKYILKKTSLSEAFPFIQTYRGVPNLLPYNSEVWNNYNLDAQLGDPLGKWGDVSRIGDWYLNNDRPMPLFSYAEMCFLKAEAALNGNWPGDPMEYLKAGIRASMEVMNAYAETPKISEMEISNYLNQLQAADLETIITQKYIHFTYENVFEAYADYRRTGFPVLLDYYGESIDQTIFPKRLKYPYSEFTYNRDNYLQAIEQQGIDSQLTPIWWNK
ncbi:MAG: SusD/RagB family nutrient-binding outer membrane lipoprotein [Bacteroidales bacterium]|nr:SusD/RagB family nutrient-binding outer membrane lipoprotein [Bacteroidales bacterium]